MATSRGPSVATANSALGVKVGSLTRQSPRSSSSVLFVVEPRQPGGQPLDRDLELGVEVHERPQVVGQPLEGDLLLTPAGGQLLDAPVREVHAREAIARYAAWLSQPRGIPRRCGRRTRLRPRVCPAGGQTRGRKQERGGLAGQRVKARSTSSACCSA